MVFVRFFARDGCGRCLSRLSYVAPTAPGVAKDRYSDPAKYTELRERERVRENRESETRDDGESTGESGTRRDRAERRVRHVIERSVPCLALAQQAARPPFSVLRFPVGLRVGAISRPVRSKNSYRFFDFFQLRSYVTPPHRTCFAGVAGKLLGAFWFCTNCMTAATSASRSRFSASVIFVIF